MLYPLSYERSERASVGEALAPIPSVVRHPGAGAAATRASRRLRRPRPRIDSASCESHGAPSKPHRCGVTWTATTCGCSSHRPTASSRARARGELAALAPKKRGRKPTPIDPRDRKIAELERQLANMTGRAERAEALVEVQKNLAALLGRPGTSAQS